MKSDYGPQFINNTFLLKSSLCTSREYRREGGGVYGDESRGNVKGMRRSEEEKKETKNKGEKCQEGVREVGMVKCVIMNQHLNKCRTILTNQILVIKTLDHCFPHQPCCNKPPLCCLQAIEAYLKSNRYKHENQPAALLD